MRFLAMLRQHWLRFFIGRDAEEKDAPIAGADDIKELKKEIMALAKSINELKIRSV